MMPQEIIAAKRDGKALSPEQIHAFIGGALDGSFKDYQVSALLMAIVLRGMDTDETEALTEAMLRSGKVIDLSEIKRPKVDKHSTGGVGDKVSLILSPLVAAAGLAVPMISGRGLGHTGGTLDKLEAIPGIRTDLDEGAYRAQVARIHQAIISQTADMVPADRLLYALRDVTATVESIPLITGSILSKKLAEGIDALVLDVKVGKGAFMKTEADARALAESMVSVCRKRGKPASALLTRMDEPLGHAVGNALEVIESIECLKGRGPDDLMEVTLELGAEMLLLGGIASGKQEALEILRGVLADGSALAAFRELIEAQGGDPVCCDDYARLPKAPATESIRANRSAIGATIRTIDAAKVGEAARLLGAGRTFAGETLDLAVGISALAKVGERISAERPLAILHHRGDDPERIRAATARLVSAFTWGDALTGPALPRVVARIRSGDVA